MTREQIRALAGPAVQTATLTSPASVAPARVAAQPPPPKSAGAPVLPAEVAQVFGAPTGPGAIVYTPAVLGLARVHALLPDGGAHTHTVTLVAPLAADSPGPDWSAASELGDAPASTPAPAEGASFAPLPPAVGKSGAASRWEKSLVDAIYRTRSTTLFESKRLRLLSRAGESERDFRIRIAEAMRASRDAEVDALRQKYAARLASLEDRIRRAGQAVSREKDQADGQRVQTAVSFGATLLTAFLGRKKLSQSTLGRAATTARGAERAAREGRDVARAEESLEALRARHNELNRELEAELAALSAHTDGSTEPLAERIIRPRKADVEVTSVALYWVPTNR